MSSRSPWARAGSRRWRAASSRSWNRSTRSSAAMPSNRATTVSRGSSCNRRLWRSSEKYTNTSASAPAFRQGSRRATSRLFRVSRASAMSEGWTLSTSSAKALVSWRADRSRTVRSRSSRIMVFLLFFFSVRDGDGSRRTAGAARRPPAIRGHAAGHGRGENCYASGGRKGSGSGHGR